MANARQFSLLRSVKKTVLMLALASAPLALVLVAGCGGGGTSGGGGSGGSAACFDYASFKGDAAVTFSAKVLPIFQRSCGVSSSCHQNETPPSPAQHYFGPKMGTATTPAQITTIFMQSVGVASTDNPDMKIIDPGKPETSFIMYKLDDEVKCSKLTCAAKNECLGSMPQGAAILSQADRDTIRSWIKNGALNN